MNKESISVEFDLVNWCTLRCVGCQSLTKKNAVNLDFDLALSKIPEDNIKQIILCGDVGEPTLHPEITQIILKCLTRTDLVYISTNAELFRYLDLGILQDVKKQIFFEISVDGPNNEVHTITRCGGNLDRVLKNSMALKKLGFNVEFVYTRHKLNESFVAETHQMIKNLFGEVLRFRDTNEVGSMVSPPSKKSGNSDVSIFYKDNLPDNRKLISKIYAIEPDTEYKYVRNDGEIFPCWAFCETKPGMTEGMSYDSLCGWYREHGDIRRCILNCGIYHTDDYRYDELDEVL